MRILTSFFLLSAAVWGQTAPGFDPTAIDHNVNPCENFYQFACGAWMAANPIPAEGNTFEDETEHGPMHNG